VKVVIDALTRSGAADVLEGLNPDAPRVKRRLWRIEGKKERFELPHVQVRRTPPFTPQPPWLDVGDIVRIKETREEGFVTGVDHCIVGPLYRVRCYGSFERSDLPREALEFRRDFLVPF
jgi:hypothetical protein